MQINFALFYTSCILSIQEKNHSTSFYGEKPSMYMSESPRTFHFARKKVDHIYLAGH